MFAKRIVTKAVSKSCLFCDACMNMVNDDEDYVIMSFTPTSGPSYTKRETKKTERFVVCKKCYETMTGSYMVHKQMIEQGSENVFQKEGITEREMRALLNIKPPAKEEVTVEKRHVFSIFSKSA